jgi:hypothetical protein
MNSFFPQPILTILTILTGSLRYRLPVYSRDTFYLYCNAKQAEKVSLQLAINARDPNTQALILKIMQQRQVKIIRLHASPNG